MGPLDAIRPHLEIGSVNRLAIACNLRQHYCRKFFPLDRLLAVLTEEADAVGADVRRLALFWNEVVGRLLVLADRKAWRDRFLDLFRGRHLQCPALHQFVHEHYRPRASGGGFAGREAAYLTALRAAHLGGTAYADGVGHALAWFGAMPGQSRRDRFGVLFSNAGNSRRFPDRLEPGVCVSFTFWTKTGTQPFAAWDLNDIGDQFRQAAAEAEEAAYRLCGKSFGNRNHRQVRVEQNLDDKSVLEGSSGYLAFVMAHLCQLRGLPLSPYIGFTGSMRELGRLGSVADLPEKLSAAALAGMARVYVPQSDYNRLSPDLQAGMGLLQVMPYPDTATVEAVAPPLFEQLRSWTDPVPQEAAVSPPPMPPRTVPVKPASSPRPVVVPPPPPVIRRPPPVVNPIRPVLTVPPPPTTIPPPTTEGKLFGGRPTAFQECFGSAVVGAPATAVAFADDEDRFVVAYPGRQRLYLFDILGTLVEKVRTDQPAPQTPLTVAWSDEPAGFLVGFHTGRVWRFGPNMEALRESLTPPAGVVPRHLATAGSAIFAADGPVVVRFGPAGPVRADLPDSVGRLVYAEGIDRLLACLPCRVIALTRDLKRDWEEVHPGGPAVAGCGSTGDVWLALSTGRLWRLTGAARRRSNDAPTAAAPTGLAVLPAAVVVAGRDGQLVLHDPAGREIGRDDLLTPVNALAAGAGNCLVAATARGPSVLQPHPDLLQLRVSAADAQAVRVADDLVRSWADGSRPLRTYRDFLDGIDLLDWPRVLALQAAFVARLAADPAARQMADQFRTLDSLKCEYLFSRTKPAFIDGSNVSRSHFVQPPPPGQRARLAAILAMREKLGTYRNPALYPIVTVVDSTERHVTDKRDELVQLIADGEIEETPSEREADALILNRIRDRRWFDCVIVSRDRALYEAHKEMLPEVPRGWYEGVRWTFRIDPRSAEVTIVERSQ